jgi:hypothetical protein
MENVSLTAGPFDAWLSALEERHLARFTPSEVGRALRALSSCYVERRSRLVEGVALETAGKRAAFALFYSPLHLLTTARILRQLPAHATVRTVVDLGCGTGAAGAAWAIHSAAAGITGFDRHPWAVDEANWTYRTLGLRGRAHRQDIVRVRLEPAPGQGILAAYALNELSAAAREAWLPRLLQAAGRGSTILIIEPIARRMSPWWRDWEEAFVAVGGRADEWRFAGTLPRRQRELAKSAGLDPRELTARSLFAG